jgi:hypothetical protein
MAVDARKTTYVFDVNESKWFVSRNGSAFIETSTPTLTKNFAGIGTRGIKQSNGEYILQDNAKQAIRNVYEKTFNQSKELTTIPTQLDLFAESEVFPFSTDTATVIFSTEPRAVGELVDKLGIINWDKVTPEEWKELRDLYKHCIL